MNADRGKSASQYVIVWEFRVRPELVDKFVESYGPEGDWVQLFREEQGFVKTELVRDVAVPGHFLTLDYWESEDAFNRLRRQESSRYYELDDELRDLSEEQRRLGAFWQDSKAKS